MASHRVRTLSPVPVAVAVAQKGVRERCCSAAALVLLSGVAYCRAGNAAGGGRSIRGLRAVARRGEMARPSGIVESRRAECGDGDERSGAFGGGAGAAKVVDAANPLPAAMRQPGRNGVLPAKVAVRLRLRLA